MRVPKAEGVQARSGMGLECPDGEVRRGGAGSYVRIDGCPSERPDKSRFQNDNFNLKQRIEANLLSLTVFNNFIKNK
jgi:hypothetical protein